MEFGALSRDPDPTPDQLELQEQLDDLFLQHDLELIRIWARNLEGRDE